MVQSSGSRLFLIIICFLVFSIPLLFFYHILSSSFIRNREATEGFLREKLLSAAEKISENLKPSTYVKNTIANTHKSLLPGIVPEISDMYVDNNFGKAEFNSELPLRITEAMQKKSMNPLMVVVNPPGFVDAFYIASPELASQCNYLKELAWTLTRKAIDYAQRVFRQKNQTNWSGEKHLLSWLNLVRIIGEDHNRLVYEYLSRFGEIIYYNDNQTFLFTDYFGRQVMYFYAFNCISRKSLHGSYSVVVLQSEVKSDDVLEAALVDKQKDLRLSLQKNTSNNSGFFNSPDGISYVFLPPTQFQNHQIFEKRFSSDQKFRTSPDTAIKATALWPESIINFASLLKTIRFAFNLVFLAFLLIAFRFYLFGFSLPVSLNLKLKALISMIILIPVAGISLLLFSSIPDFERLIDYHVFKKTINRLSEARVTSDENFQRSFLTALETRRELETRPLTNRKELFSWVRRKKHPDKWFFVMTKKIMTCFADGEKIYFSDFGMAAPYVNAIISSVATRYMQNLGLLETDTSVRQFNKEDMTMGFLEEYITPEIEEQFAVHEGTIQREYVNTGDTNLMSLMIIKFINEKFVALIQGINQNNDLPFQYLTRLVMPGFNYFRRNERLCEIDMSVRLRKATIYDSYAWNFDPFSNNSTVEAFNKANENRSSGQNEMRDGNSLTVNAWLFRNGRSEVLLAQGKKIFKYDVFLIALIISGSLLIFSLILMNFLADFFNGFVSVPLKIFEHNINELKQGNLGIRIKPFSSDEFNSITEAFNKMSMAVKQKEQMSRYVSDRLLNEVEAGKVVDNSIPEVRKMSVLASDIRGFTSICEKNSPADIVEMLNLYFTEMEQAIASAGGFIEKYVGDAVSAVFFDEENGENSSIKACRAAILMKQALKNFNLKRAEASQFTIENGIGIVTDQAMSGTIGNPEGRRDYTIIGKITEDAANLESLTKKTISRILVCSNSKKLAQDSFSFNSFENNCWELNIEKQN